MSRMSACLATLLLLAGCNKEPSTYDEAVTAYGQYRVAEAEAALRKIAADPAVGAGDKGRAHRELARIAWLIDGNSRGALESLAKAEAADREKAEAAAKKQAKAK